MKIDVKGVSGKWLRSYQVDTKQIITLAGSKWTSMNARLGEGYQKTYPSYVGCSTEFESVHHLCEWSRQQIGYCESWHLDKDLLSRGNKVYSESSCVYLPNSLNTLILKNDAVRGEYPLGVTYKKESNSYRARCHNGSGPAKSKHLGYFKTPEEAFEAYKKFKESYIKQQAEIWREHIDPRAYEALMSYQVEITD